MLKRLQDWLRHPAVAPLASAIIVTGFLWVFIGLDIERGYATARRLAESEAMAFARVFEEHAAAAIRQADLLTRDVGRGSEASGAHVNWDRLFEDHVASPLQHYIALAIYDSAGRPVRRSDRAVSAAETIDRREDFLALAGSPGDPLHIGLPFRDDRTGRTVIPLSRRMTGPDGSFAGIAVAEFDPRYFATFYASVGLGPQSTISLARADGVVLACQVLQDDVVGRSFGATPIWSVLREVPVGQFEAPSAIDGVERVYAYRTSQVYPLVTFVGLASTEVFAAARQRMTHMLAGGGLITLLIAGGGLALLRQTSRSAAETRRREAAEQQATRLGQIMQGLLHLPVLTYRVDERGIITEATGAGLHRIGMADHEAEGRGVDETWPHLAEQIRHLPPGGWIRFECGGAVCDQPYAFDNFLMADQGTGRGAMGVSIDITERTQAEEALRAAKEEADRAHADKSRLLAVASHDLRQPLQAAMLFHHLLAPHCHGGTAGDMHARLGKSIAATQEMLASLLDLSRLDAGTLEAECRGFALQEMLDRLAGEFAPLAAAAGLEFRLVRSRQRVFSDPHLLERMLRNLLANAVRYTPNGRVLLGCRRRGGSLAVQVWDTGAGIAAEDLSTIFTEYYQGENGAQGDGGADDQPRGLGLGLSIVSRLGRLLGHPVGVCSTPGRGSMFEVAVPLADSTAAPGTAAPGDTGPGATGCVRTDGAASGADGRRCRGSAAASAA